MVIKIVARIVGKVERSVSMNSIQGWLDVVVSLGGKWRGGADRRRRGVVSKSCSESRDAMASLPKVELPFIG